ncbi:LysR family transcriptional regulator [Cupriavidus sp. DF5525]|uniref:LysR family transcriptional regulator n=1 Tax=Cupriavidus sp. DF5525 TaxID=3160989 RepID=UPI0003B0E383|nr:hypothetical protein N234_33700 [Ralstonia pickettii DTP0602]
MRYDLTSLEVFVTVADEQNLTRAAARRNLAVSAVSKRIAELEEEVGCALLVRYPRGVGLTPAGQALLHYARQLLHTLHQMENELSEYADGIKGHVRLHAINSALVEFLTPDLHSFMKQYPLIRLDIEEHPGGAIVRAIAEGAVEVGVFSAHTPAPGLQVFPYRVDELVVAVPEGHEFAGKRRVSFFELAQHELVVPHTQSSVHAVLERQAKEDGVQLKQRIRVSSFDSMCQLVAGGFGLALMPRGVLRPLARTLKLKAVAIDAEWATRPLVIGVRDYEAVSHAARAFVDHLRQQAG